MRLWNTAKLKSVFAKKRYIKSIIQQYDMADAVINSENQPLLTPEVFAEFGIYTLKDLQLYLHKKSEYGGYVRVPWKNKNILIPFHNDFFNSWLRFDNPRVIAFYNELYEHTKDRYQNRTHFDMTRFNIEEDMQMNNWRMPTLDRKMLAAPINGCWDKPELISCFLEFQGYTTKRFCCHDGIIMRGHCFAAYFDGQKWSTCDSGLTLKDKDFNKFCRRIYNILKCVPIFKNPSACELIEYPAPKPEICTYEFIENIRNGRIIIKGNSR